MAYNKTKHLDAAQKYLQHGKLPQAIAEYQQILKNEPKDQVTLMTLGDLHVRQGDTSQALEYFERLAKVFLNDGFTTKAIAIYKKVAKLAPEETRPLERLAELYVQQGVLSEARPIYLQLAEAQLKAGNKPQSAALLDKLLDAEPDNLRVQMRLAELQLSMGDQKRALASFQGALQRLFDQGEHEDVVRLADKILKLDPAQQSAFQLKVRALSAGGKGAEAAALLENVPDQDDGGETTTMLLNEYAARGKKDKAYALAERVFARDPKNYLITYRVANSLLESGDVDKAGKLLQLVRNTMIDSGEHEDLAQAISRLVEARPGDLEPLEWLVDLYGRASDSFRLPDALAQLALAYEHAGNNEKAIRTYQQLLERTPEDESTRRKYLLLCSKAGFDPAPEGRAIPVTVDATQDEPPAQEVETNETGLDEETRRYVTQALTEVDLFSSYGLTQKAIELLESAVLRAPRHAVLLERLLDLSLGTGNEQRTAELATTLEKIAVERNDQPAIERYAEFRRRYQKAAGFTPSVAPATSTTLPSQVSAQEFSVPTIEAELDEPVHEMPVAEPPPSVHETAAEAPAVETAPEPVPAKSVVHEVDLSEEWAALSQQLDEAIEQEVSASPQAPEEAPESSAPVSVPKEAEEILDSVKEIQDEAAAEAPAFELELQAVAAEEKSDHGELSADELMADLMADLESATNSLKLPAELPVPVRAMSHAPVAGSMASAGSLSSTPASAPPASSPAGAGNGTSAEGPLGDLFEEFRADLGENVNKDEDIETHYNLGIAYREMGLLEEAISEFQKVAQSADRGAAFRYAMQCSTLLGLAFMEKGQPAIAAIWYERALKTPGLDQESILALRYDLGVAQELAGDRAGAYASFSQVYAMNIDYRDVSERVSLLGKAQ